MIGVEEDERQKTKDKGKKIKELRLTIED